MVLNTDVISFIRLSAVAKTKNVDQQLVTCSETLDYLIYSRSKENVTLSSQYLVDLLGATL